MTEEKEKSDALESESVSERPDYDEEIVTLIQSAVSPKMLRDKLSNFHTNDIAQAFSLCSLSERERLYRILSPDMLEEVLNDLEDDERAAFFNEIHVKKALAILNHMDAGDAAQLLQQLSKSKRDILLELLHEDKRDQIALVLSYGEDEIASYMSTDFIKISRNLTIKEAMRSLFKQAKESDEISILYVVDENNLYYGAIHIQDLFVARANDNLEDIIETNFPFVYANELIDDLMEDLKDYSEDSIPVLNYENKILGIIAHRELRELFNAEMEEDYVRLAGLSSKEDLEEGLFKSISKRLPWLCVLLALALGVSSIVSLFEGVVAKVAVAVAFQSLILAMAGNVGTQSLAVSIRVLMDEALSSKQKLYLVSKEVRIGLVNGLILGSFSFVILGLYLWFFKDILPQTSFSISFCVGIAMVLAMAMSSFTGTSIPILFKTLKMDPAVASGPLITTLNDLIGVVTYYSLIWVFLIQILHI